MAFAEDLLDQAFLLLTKETKNPKQASLRRAVSTAYYAKSAFIDWKSIRKEHAAQRYLVSLLSNYKEP